MEEESKMGMWLEKVMPKFFLFIIRLVECFAASIVPSVISVIIIFFAPSDRAWDVLSIAVFAVTLAVNWHFWMDFAIRRDNIKEFYIINGLVYAIYIGASIAGYYLLGYLVYSMTFANLRFCEAFEVKTLYSSFIANGITVAVMVICERCSRLRIAKLKEDAKLNAADKPEMKDESEDIQATKQNKVIIPLSAEQLEREIEKDEAERLKAAEKAKDSVPEEMWSGELSKGRGEEIVRVDYSAEGPDTDENDFMPDSDKNNDNEAYGAGSLWNPEIYKGRTADGKPITEFDDEERELPPEPEDGGLWDESLYQGRDAQNRPERLGELYSEEEKEAAEAASENIRYGSDSLWEHDFYQGKDKTAVPERVLDFDEAVEDPGHNYSEKYESGALWESISKGRGAETEPEEPEINPNNDYEAESLWDKDMRQGKKKGL